MTEEGLLKKSICEYLLTQPCFFTLTTNLQASRNTRRSKHNVIGWPDITGVWKGGRMFLIEVKSSKGIVSEEQLTVISLARKMGAIAFIARSVEDVVSEFEWQL